MNKDLKKLVRDRFSSFSEIEEYRKRVESGLLPWEERISELFLSIPGRLLDIGCGGGREAIALSTLRHEIIGHLKAYDPGSHGTGDCKYNNKPLPFPNNP